MRWSIRLTRRLTASEAELLKGRGGRRAVVVVHEQIASGMQSTQGRKTRPQSSECYRKPDIGCAQSSGIRLPSSLDSRTARKWGANIAKIGFERSNQCSEFSAKGVATVSRISKVSVALASAAVLLAATAAVAGSGVGGVFNLGQANTVGARTQLSGATATQQLYVRNSSTAAGASAVWGQANRLGVRAVATSKTGMNYGIYATTPSYNGLAGFFRNTGSPPDLTYGTAIRALGATATGDEYDHRAFAAGGGEFIGYNGVVGAASFPNGAGVLALAGKGDYGVIAQASSNIGWAGFFRNAKGNGVIGLSGGATSANHYNAGGTFSGPTGVVAETSDTQGTALLARQGKGLYAIQTDGDVYVHGTLYKSQGGFRIDHPFDPANRYLSHSFVESPDMKNVYDGIVITGSDGKAVVTLPSYFEALNRDPRYQLTVIGSAAQAYISQEVSNNSFAIVTSVANTKVSWQITGIRRDAYAEAHRIVVEQEKSVSDRGRYLHPVEFGQPIELGIASMQLPRQQVPAETGKAADPNALSRVD